MDDLQQKNGSVANIILHKMVLPYLFVHAQRRRLRRVLNIGI
jgi:hypothetical protein